MILCPRCGSLLDGPRENPKTRRLGRKCVECLSWQDLPAAGSLASQARRPGGTRPAQRP